MIKTTPCVFRSIHKDVLDDIVAVCVHSIGYHILQDFLNDLGPYATLGIHEQALHHAAAIHILAHGNDLPLKLNGLPLGAARGHGRLPIEQCLLGMYKRVTTSLTYL